MYNKEKYQENRESIIKRVVNYQLKQLENDNKKLKTTQRARALFSMVLKPRKIKQSKTIEHHLGFDIKTLKDHLKSTLPSGYTWKDYEEGKLISRRFKHSLSEL